MTAPCKKYVWQASQRMESAAYGISRECPNSLKTLAYRQLREIENAGFSASALHLIRVCSVSEREVRKALMQLLFRLLHLKTRL